VADRLFDRDYIQARLINRILSLYYAKDLTQSEIAQQLGLSTTKVNRLLQLARRNKMVEFTIKTPFQHLFNMEAELQKHFDLQDAWVIPLEGTETSLRSIGMAGARFLLDHLQDGDVIASGAWNGSSISISADGLPLGVHNFTLEVRDTGDNSARDTAFITVVDGTAPTIDRPVDLLYEHGTTGHTIVWTPLDSNPALYVVLQDGDVVASDVWNGSSISMSLDGLNPGSYNYTITVYDATGNSVSDQVMVVVTPSSSTTTTTTTGTTTGTPMGIDILSMLLGAGVTLAVVVIIIVVTRKR